MKSFFMYVYIGMKLRFIIFNIFLLFLVYATGYSQEIRLDHRLTSDKTKTIRLDKPVMVKTFEGEKIKGVASVKETGTLIIEGKEIALDKVMTISGFVVRSSKEKAVGLGLSIGAGIIAIPALYYILGGIAWGMPNGIFVGATVLVFDLFLVYAGINLMGIYPRRFSTMNWNIVISPSIPLPLPND